MDFFVEMVGRKLVEFRSHFSSNQVENSKCQISKISRLRAYLEMSTVQVTLAL